MPRPSTGSALRSPLRSCWRPSRRCGRRSCADSAAPAALSAHGGHGRAPTRLTAAAPAAQPAVSAELCSAAPSQAASSPASNASPAPVASTTPTARGDALQRPADPARRRVLPVRGGDGAHGGRTAPTRPVPAARRRWAAADRSRGPIQERARPGVSAGAACGSTEVVSRPLVPPPAPHDRRRVTRRRAGRSPRDAGGRLRSGQGGRRGRDGRRRLGRRAGCGPRRAGVLGRRRLRVLPRPAGRPPCTWRRTDRP